MDTDIIKEKKSIERGAKIQKVHWLVVIGSLILTFFAWQIAKKQEDQLNKRRFQYEVQKVSALIKERMNKYEDALRGGVGAIAAKNGVMDHKSWVKFTESINIGKRYPGVNGIGVIYQVEKENLASFIAKHKKSQPNFKVHPPHKRNEFLPITYIEPIKINRAALGLDMAHETNRYTAAVLSRDTGESTITGPIILVQDNQKTPGFLFFAPFYKSEKTRNKKERKENFIGLVYAPFIVKNLVAGNLAESSRAVNISISDDNEIIYNEITNKSPDYDENPQFKKEIKIALYARNWNINIQTKRSFRKAVNFSQSQMILYGGLFVDTMLLLVFILLSRSNKRAISFATRLNQFLENRTIELEKANKAKNHFIASMNHELRTPLNIIIGYSDILIEDTNSSNANEVKNYGNKILRSAKHLLSIINDIIDVSIVDSKNITLYKKDFDLNEFVDEIYDMGQTLAKKNQNQFTAENRTNIENIYTDKNRLRQVLMNVISNAAKYTKNGSITLTVNHVQNKETKCLEFEIKDTGIGIKESNLKNVFKRFVQVHDIYSTSISGTGLGLSLAQDLIKIMGGKIKVDSELGKGSTFKVILPLKKDKD